MVINVIYIYVLGKTIDFSSRRRRRGGEDGNGEEGAVRRGLYSFVSWPCLISHFQRVRSLPPRRSENTQHSSMSRQTCYPSCRRGQRSVDLNRWINCRILSLQKVFFFSLSIWFFPETQIVRSWPSVFFPFIFVMIPLGHIKNPSYRGNLRNQRLLRNRLKMFCTKPTTIVWGKIKNREIKSFAKKKKQKERKKRNEKGWLLSLDSYIMSHSSWLHFFFRARIRVGECQWMSNSVEHVIATTK